jgi:hypothetical protein
MLRGRPQSLSTACSRRLTAYAALRFPGAAEAQRSASLSQSAAEALVGSRPGTPAAYQTTHHLPLAQVNLAVTGLHGVCTALQSHTGHSRWSAAAPARGMADPGDRVVRAPGPSVAARGAAPGPRARHRPRSTREPYRSSAPVRRLVPCPDAGVPGRRMVPRHQPGARPAMRTAARLRADLDDHLLFLAFHTNPQRCQPRTRQPASQQSWRFSASVCRRPTSNAPGHQPLWSRAMRGGTGKRRAQREPVAYRRKT